MQQISPNNNSACLCPILIVINLEPQSVRKCRLGIIYELLMQLLGHWIALDHGNF